LVRLSPLTHKVWQGGDWMGKILLPLQGAPSMKKVLLYNNFKIQSKAKYYHIYEGVSKSFQTELIMKYMLTVCITH